MLVENRSIALTFSLIAFTSLIASADEIDLQLRHQTETALKSGRFNTLHQEAKWNPKETALIVCDAWDAHHCLNAVRRLEQFAPRLDKVIKAARQRGVTIIHAPSDCMEFYKHHAARLRSIEIPQKESPPADIKSWCSAIPTEEQGIWPIDQSDGGEDDDPAEHAEWVEKLKSQGRNPGTPWKRQTELITIDDSRDYISDKGDEVWRILTKHQIKNVILTGVHTNMCVVGRPFGLRQMVRNGFQAVLMRDMTDTMYNPQRWPYVSHFAGTDLIVSHIERHVCPTITSDQIIGGKPFRFKKDTRPRLAIISAEDEYETNRTLPEFAIKQLGHDFSTTLLFGNAKDRHDIPGMQSIEDADIVLVSIRRRWLPEPDMKRLREFIAAGRPVVGIRTASHAFSVRNKSPDEGFADWTTFDQQVFGGNYHGHHGNKLKSTVRAAANAAHPILRGMTSRKIPQGGSLYKTSPLMDGTTVLMTGTVEGYPTEPVAWTFQRADGGKSFYTSLGSPDDFENPEFVRLLRNGLRWAAGLETPVKSSGSAVPKRDYRDHWSLVKVPEDVSLSVQDQPAWYRCAVRIPAAWTKNPLQLKVAPQGKAIAAWLNGHAMESDKLGMFSIDPDSIYADDTNLLVVRVDGAAGLRQAPILRAGSKSLSLSGHWQFRTGENQAFSNIPLPAKFGTSADIFFGP